MQVQNPSWAGGTGNILLRAGGAGEKCHSPERLHSKWIRQHYNPGSELHLSGDYMV